MAYTHLQLLAEKRLFYFFKSIRNIRKTAKEIIFLGNGALEKECDILKHIYYTPAESCHF